jgi:hypothetical protein
MTFDNTRGGRNVVRGGRRGGGQTDDGTKNPTATPFLFIPVSPGDTGARPIAPDQAVMNASIQATPGWNGGVLANKQLSCKVKNLGVVACVAGLAEFYTGDQFNFFISGHEALTPAQVQANARVLGYGTFQVPPGGTATVVCDKPWEPASHTDSEEGVLVQLYDLFTDHMTSPFNAINDRHVGRNDGLADHNWREGG